MTTETLDQARERLRPYVEKARGFSGWMGLPAFRRLGPENPWDYIDRARQLVVTAGSVLDMGTGGGERFGEILRGQQVRAVATEAWPVNVPVAATYLKPFGAAVVRSQSVMLPFANESFELILDRHDDLDPTDVARILKPGGTVLTQQAFMVWKEMNRFVPRRAFLAHLFEDYRDGLAAGGLDVVDARSLEGPAAFDSLGDLVYMLCVLGQREVPDFDPLGSDLEALLQLERELTTPDGLVLTDGSFIIEARKP